MKSLLEALRSQASKTFESSADKVQALLEKASDDVTSRVRRLEASEGDDDGGGMGAKAKSKSMQQQKEEQLARRRALADARTEVGLLGALIRLADYMMVGALMSLAIDSSADMLSTLVLPRDKGDKGVFFCALSMVPGDIEFSPLEEEVVAFSIVCTPPSVMTPTLSIRERDRQRERDREREREREFNLNDTPQHLPFPLLAFPPSPPLRSRVQ
jgi:hypothetical protein